MATIKVYRSSANEGTVLVGIDTGDRTDFGGSDETARLEHVTRYCAVLGGDLGTYPTLEGIATAGELSGEDAVGWVERYRDERIHAGAAVLDQAQRKCADALAYLALFADGECNDVVSAYGALRDALARNGFA